MVSRLRSCCPHCMSVSIWHIRKNHNYFCCRCEKYFTKPASKMFGQNNKIPYGLKKILLEKEKIQLIH